MPKTVMTKEDFSSKLNLCKQILLENGFELKESEDNKSLLIHESSKLPREFILFVSLHPKVSKFIVGVKSYSKNNKEKILELYENLPLDVKGRLHNAFKYISITNEIKFKDIDENTLNSVKLSLDFYKECFKEFLN